ncbi:MAG: sugar phosphate isomerase/epimerase, partial [Clostridiales bacterium]
PGMVMHINNGDVLPPLEEEFLDFFRILAQKAKECQITLALENVLRNDYVEAILKAPGCENLRLCYDSSHDQLAQKFIDYPPYQLLEKLPQKVAFLHLSDNKGNRESHWLPGHGILNWHQICRNLAQAGFSGQITLEITPSAKEKALSAGEFLDLAYHSIVAIISDEKNSQYFAHPINQDGI